jgi:hypothetical protein
VQSRHDAGFDHKEDALTEPTTLISKFGFKDGDLTTPIHEADYVGGLVVIRRDVAESGIRYAYDPLADGSSASEDITFCRRARAAGFRTYLDADVRVDHYGIAPWS